MLLLLAWQAGAGAVLMLALALAITIYMASHIFASPEVEATAKAELYEAISAIILVGLLSILITMADSFSAVFTGGETMVNASYAITSAQMQEINAIMGQVEKIASVVGKLSTQFAFCQIVGSSISISMSNCGSFRTLLNILSASAQIIAVAQVQLAGLQMLVAFGRDYGITYIFMLGALLRCFRVSRGAGAFLLALAVSLYFLVPLLIVFTDQIITSWGLSYFHVENTGQLLARMQSLSDYIAGSECNPFEKPEVAEATFTEMLYKLMDEQFVEMAIYFFIFRATLLTVMVLSTITVGTRALGSAFGAEIDVSGIARLM
ncbi:MAG: hypothetical protein QW035_04615 [Candidatus Anstonellales archaeon]